MSTVQQSLREAVRRLGEESARSEAEILFAHASGQSRTWLITHAADIVDETIRVTFDALIARRAAGEPVAYLVGTRGFRDIELEVTPDVLIPRPETELLVELALARIPPDVGSPDAACSPDEAAKRRNPGPAMRATPDSAARHPDYTVADLGTGSGAIALAIAKARPHTQVLATDASDAALAVARQNAQRLGLGNVGFAGGDWCAALGGQHFDLIVSNPPYIAEGDAHLREGGLRFEPPQALSSGPDGLDAIRIIVRDARAHLRDDGWLLLEHGFDQGDAVRGLLQQAGYRHVFTTPDLEGRDRVSGGMVAH